MKTVTIEYVNGTQETYRNVMKVWLENSTKRYILHYKNENDLEVHTFINRENVLLVEVKDPDGWKEKEPKRRKGTRRYVDGKPYYTGVDENEDEEE